LCFSIGVLYYACQQHNEAAMKKLLLCGEEAQPQTRERNDDSREQKAWKTRMQKNLFAASFYKIKSQK